MTTEVRPLVEHTAADLMTREPLVIPRQMSLRAAAHLMSQAHVTGAPVVDESGACVGVISATDIMRCGDRMATLAECERLPSLCVCADWQMVELEKIATDAVSDWMSKNLIFAGPGTSIGELARLMLDAHVHRVVIIDPRERPIGVVSTMDVLRAVAEAVDGGD